MKKEENIAVRDNTFDHIDLEIPNFEPVSFLLCFTVTVNILFSRMLILLKLKFETLLFLSISNKSFIYCTVQTTDWCFVWFAITCSRPLQYTITWWFYPNLDLYLYQGSISFEKLIFNRNQNHLIHLFEIDILTRIRSIDHSVDYSWPFYWLSLINYFKPNFILWCRTMIIIVWCHQI